MKSSFKEKIYILLLAVVLALTVAISILMNILSLVWFIVAIIIYIIFSRADDVFAGTVALAIWIFAFINIVAG